MEQPVLIIGHKNPDADSICSSIAYAWLKNQLGIPARPARLGPLNHESQYILKRFHQPVPELIRSAKCTLAEIDKDEAVLIRRDTTMKEALDAILQRKNKGVFVTDSQRHLEGIVSVSDLTSLWTASEDSLQELMKRVPLSNIVKTTQAQILNDAPFSTNGKVHLMPSLCQNSSLEPGTIVIVGNNPDVQRTALRQKASLLVICGENWIDSITLEMAKAQQVPVIHTPLSAISVAHRIFQSPSVEEVMTRDIVVFRNSENVDGASQRIAKTRFRTYPVINEKQQVIGAISRFHLFNYRRKQFILVDHNEKEQSVNDLDFGEIVEIVDHHRIGGMETQSPITFINQIVGSTCTIIAQLFQQHQVAIPQDIAGVLLAGMLSDTMNLKSPTTTDLDRKIALWLAELSHQDIDVLADELVATSDSLLNKSYQELMYEDFKEYRIADSKVAIGQVVCRDSEEYHRIRQPFLHYLEEQNLQHQYDLLLILFTDPTGRGSHFLYTGKKSWVIEEGFKQVLHNGFADDLISRKKQVLPVILDTIRK